MKIITVKSPWWWWIFHGKDIENRSRPWNYSGPLLISASKALHIGNTIRDTYGALKMAGQVFEYGRHMTADDHLPYCGKIVGLVEMNGCSHIDAYGSGSRWAVGPYCYRLSHQRLLPNPIPWKGAQGVQNAPDDIRVEVGRQLGI